MRSMRVRKSFVGLLGVALFASASVYAIELTELEKAGQKIYRSGQSPYGNEIIARIGQANIPMPATTVPCEGCHGRDGLGRPEGGVVPANINWRHLAKPYGSHSQTGRQFEAYDEARFFKAISDGVDPSGNRLDAAMPRFSIGRKETRALIAYLKRIEQVSDPGVSERELRIGSFVPGSEVAKPIADAISSVLAAYFSEVNNAGGIYGRKLILVSEKIENETDFIRQAESFIDTKDVFAFVSSFTGSSDAKFSQWIETKSIPSIAPFTRFPDSSATAQRYTFRLFGGLSEEAQAMAQFIHHQQANASLAIVHDTDVAMRALADQATQRLKASQYDLRDVLALPDTQEQLTQYLQSLRQKDVSSLLFLGSENELLTMLGQLDKLGWHPNILFPGVFASKNIFDSPSPFHPKLLLSYPLIISADHQKKLDQFFQFHRRHGLNQNQLMVQLHAYVAAEVLLEGLRRNGKKLDRASLVAAFDQVYGYDTGVAPPMSFSAGQRIGASGTYVMRLDENNKRLRAASEWVSLQ